MRKAVAVACLIVLVALVQHSYDASRPPAGQFATGAPSPKFVRAFDLGFHPAVASFYWIPTMPEIIDMFRGRNEFVTDLAAVNAVDPKMSYPYAFAVLTLPAVSASPAIIAGTVAIANRGIAQADPDWRIPYYMAANYYLILKDKKNALTYYDIAARTPGIPVFAARFALNFGIGANDREKTKELWKTIRDSTNDEFTKERAQAYIDRLDVFDYLEASAKAYKAKYGVYPSSTGALVLKGVIPSIPPDPFGFTFVIRPDGTAAIDLTRIPQTLQNAPTQ